MGAGDTSTDRLTEPHPALVAQDPVEYLGSSGATHTWKNAQGLSIVSYFCKCWHSHRLWLQSLACTACSRLQPAGFAGAPADLHTPPHRVCMLRPGPAHGAERGVITLCHGHGSYLCFDYLKQKARPWLHSTAGGWVHEGPATRGCALSGSAQEDDHL